MSNNSKNSQILQIISICFQVAAFSVSVSSYYFIIKREWHYNLLLLNFILIFAIFRKTFMQKITQNKRDFKIIVYWNHEPV